MIESTKPIYGDLTPEQQALKVGLVGERLTHSHSPVIHKILGNPNYRLFELEKEELSDFIIGGDYHALNVTIPYKKSVIPLCDQISDTARLCDSVNTICRRNGKLFGYNTDFVGLVTMLKFYRIDPRGKSCVVLGSGGAGGTAVKVLEYLGAKSVVTVSRTGMYNYENIGSLTDTELLVNSTPIGMFGRDNSMPVDPLIFPRLEAVVDLIANPYRTELINRSQSLGIKAVGGDAMLVAQAIAGYALFYDLPVRISDFGLVYANYRTFGGNIIIIGMPGSGKSTVGTLVAKSLGMKAIDCDDVIQEREGVAIPEIFSTKGEKYFRSLEREVIDDLCKDTGCVIITGGGAVETPENISRLRRSGMVFQLTRDLSDLATADRPVTQRDGVEELYRRRKPLYDSCSDFEVINNTPRHCRGVIVDRYYTECINTRLQSDFQASICY